MKTSECNRLPVTSRAARRAPRARPVGSLRSARGRRRREGAAYVEFLIAFPIVLMFFLCLIQLSLLFVGRLAVHHAATRAARAAVVVLPDNPSEYSGEAVNTLDPDTTSDDSSSALPGFSALGVLLSAGTSDNGSPRLNAIRSAAYIPLIPICPSVTWLARNSSVGRSFEAGVLRVGSGLIYAQGATAVTFYSAPRAAAADMKWSFSPREAITTRVTHLYNCSIPLAKDIMCSNLLRIAFTNREGRRELLYTKNPAFPLLFAVLGKKFVVLRTEVTLPNQGAEYAYH